VWSYLNCIITDRMPATIGTQPFTVPLGWSMQPGTVEWERGRRHRRALPQLDNCCFLFSLKRQCAHI
jgi:hypothetical protein